jgi:multidrug transporter EmrE-like cation transporter
MPPIIVALMSITLTVMGQLLLKLGMKQVGQVPLGELVGKLPSLLGNAKIVMGLGIYGFSAFLWLSAISRMDLSYAYPLVSLGIVLVALASVFLLHESLDQSRIIGSVLIILGILVMTGSKR